MKLNEFLKGKNRKEFADGVGICVGYLAQIAAGLRTPSGSLAVKIVKHTDSSVSFDDLFNVGSAKRNGKKGQVA